MRWASQSGRRARVQVGAVVSVAAVEVLVAVSPAPVVVEGIVASHVVVVVAAVVVVVAAVVFVVLVVVVCAVVD